MKASRQFQKQPTSSATPISQTSKRLQARPFRDPNTPTTAQPSQSSLPADYDPSARPAWWDRLTFNPQRPSTVQAKLTVGAPNDQYEQEADRVADQVMSMPDAATQQPVQREAMPEEELQTKPLAAGITPLVQREALPEEEEPVQAKASGNADIQREAMPEEEEVQTKPLASGTLQREAMPEEEDALQTKSLGTADLQREALPEEDEPLQTKPSPTPDSPLPTPSLESQLSNTQGSGSPLPNDVRSFMEPRFGADFSQVRVHTGSDAVQMNRDLNAQAFTHKQDVYFGGGKSPGNDSLTAHELTHVVQQTGNHALQTQVQRFALPALALGALQLTILLSAGLTIVVLVDKQEVARISNAISKGVDSVLQEIQDVVVQAGLETVVQIVKIEEFIRKLFISFSKGGTPGNNKEQNKQFNDAVREIGKRIGHKLSKDERQRLHQNITGQDFGFHDIVEEGVRMFGEGS